MERFELKAKEFKKMDDPINKSSGRTKYVCYIQATSIPERFDEWMSTNPREQKMTTNVAKQIRESLLDSQNFHELNRGILMSVDSVEYDNKSGNVLLTMDDPELHGNVDGGHTLRAILEAKSKNLLTDDKYVFFEVFTGLNSPVELAAARNTSVQVDLKSIEELNNSFAVVKDVYKDLPFYERIAYKMNEHYNDDIDGMDVREIIAITIMFSQEIYSFRTAFGTLSEQQPIQCYSGKEASLKKFLNLGKEKREKMIRDMKNVIPDIFKLWDQIERNFAAESNKAGKRYGTRKYSKFNDNKVVGNAFFSEEPLQYIIPKGIMYPLVGAFRALIQIDTSDGSYYWKKDPSKVWSSLASKLTTIILDEKAENPDTLAKNTNLWSNLFKEVYIFGYMS
jgi:hypothetical protein